MKDFLQESILVVNQCIPTKLQEIEKTKHLRHPSGLIPSAAGEPLLPPQSNTAFSHQQTGENITDEIYGRLVRICKWGKKGTSTMQWWGVDYTMHRSQTIKKT